MLKKSSKRFWLAVFSVTAIFFISESAFPDGRNFGNLSLIDCIGQNCPVMMMRGWSPPGYSGKKAHHTAPIRPLKALENKKNPRRKVTPAAEVETTYDFTHILPGNWEDVVGYVGFQYTSRYDNKDYIACLIGLPVESLGNSQYKSEGWDKKIFWLEVGDGAPMHVCAIYAPNYEEDGETYDNVYWAPNLQYLPPAEQDTTEARPCELWMYLDENDEVEEVWVDIYDQNWEFTRSKKLGIGDQLRSFTPLIDPSEPGSFFSTSLEYRFQTVKTLPLFLYEHLTPNVDFVNEMSKGFDFENVDLLYILYSENYNENDVSQFYFSTPKNVNLKWGNVKPTKVENWFQHEMSTLMNFFLPK